jgi:glycosyltransferase involved in cell wall biosynthesis
MRIGILGTRGIPNNYGGFEQLAEYLSAGLVQRGHEVFVYNSSLHPYKESTYKGAHLISCYDPENRLGTAGQFIYDLNCIIDARGRKFDVLLQLGYTSSSVWHFLLPRKPAVITNMDGMEWMRSKYSKKVQGFLKRAEKWAVRSSDALVADSTAIKQYLSETYQRDSDFIAYGADLFNRPDETQLSQYGLNKYAYHLAIARFEPENNLEMIIKGFLQSNSKEPLLLIGSTNNPFGRYLVSAYSCERIRFIGPLYNLDALNTLRHYSRCYFHGHSVGGTNPSLLEAMASSAYICAHGNAFNKAVLGNDAAYFYSAEDVARIIEHDPGVAERARIIANNREKIAATYSWEKIIAAYETTMLTTIKHG